jgi:hypothetical protein
LIGDFVRIGGQAALPATHINNAGQRAQVLAPLAGVMYTRRLAPM